MGGWAGQSSWSVAVDEDGAVGVVEDVVADAAHDGATDQAEAARSDDDHGGRVALRRVADELARARASHLCLHASAHLHANTRRSELVGWLE